jgi:alkanesulfonate monooxygenase SsuD/methylene tetrahydromethanopterin reductase-like flavin-dependent oxidoreductase (luciferase family)
VSIPGLERHGPGSVGAASTTSAKEVANIDTVSGGRLTFGIALDGWPADHGAEGRPRNGVGLRLEDDIRVYREVWAGAHLDACPAELGSVSSSSCQSSSYVSVRRGQSVTATTQSG